MPGPNSILPDFLNSLDFPQLTFLWFHLGNHTHPLSATLHLFSIIHTGTLPFDRYLHNSATSFFIRDSHPGSHHLSRSIRSGFCAAMQYINISLCNCLQICPRINADSVSLSLGLFLTRRGEKYVSDTSNFTACIQYRVPAHVCLKRKCKKSLT